jgi:hypothetical protein
MSYQDQKDRMDRALDCIGCLGVLLILALVVAWAVYLRLHPVVSMLPLPEVASP